MDERAIWNGFKHAKDCIMQENTTYEEIDARRGESKLFKNIDKLSKGVSDQNPAYIRSVTNPQGEVIIQYYYNVDTKEYAIIGNYKYLLYRGKMLYKHGELPFKVAQYYKRHNCVYGIGIPERVQRLKIYKTEMWQNMLDNSRMS
jgi:hypothetical protein